MKCKCKVKMKIHYKLRNSVALRGQKIMKKTNLGRKFQLCKDRFKTCFDTAKS